MCSPRDVCSTLSFPLSGNGEDTTFSYVSYVKPAALLATTNTKQMAGVATLDWGVSNCSVRDVRTHKVIETLQHEKTHRTRKNEGWKCVYGCKKVSEERQKHALPLRI